MKLTFLLGRLVYGGFFIYSGINHIKNRRTIVEYAKTKNVPAPEVAVMASTVMLLVGGTSVLLGVKPKLGAATILAFLAGVSPMMHDFWRDEDPNQKQTNIINFTKNMALAGGALALMGVEHPWPASLPTGKASEEEREARPRPRAAA